MDKSFLKNPLAIVLVAAFLALIPLLFNNDNVLVLLRILSFILFFYAIHLFFNKKGTVKK